jgi:hypothetical protein
LLLFNKNKKFLGVITYKPLSFATNQTNFGLSYNELNIFISVPDCLLRKIINMIMDSFVSQINGERTINEFFKKKEKLQL